ncbi:oleate activated transcription factor 3 [Diplogelasinospora grovesii]|uniref:Oleate activated transcription factor 3 n=1 Tax=Diplogelasinospora grovesii TaxID=303347 RepID=A0AAN6S638_9PEZI|nr:oleate activated transcription factor 3 [Diplogelasinospora grovesii]
MSEAMHAPGGSRPSRGERTTTSCTECRRRKQKCNQGHPCSNCARRFPQPICEYRSKSSRRPGAQAVAPAPQQQPAFTVPVSLLPSTLATGNNEPRFEIDGVQNPLLPLRQPSPLPSSWVKRHGENVGEIVVRWSGVDVMTQLPAPSPQSGHGYSNSSLENTGGLTPGMPMLCEEGCTVHSEAIHDAVKLLRAYHAIPDRFFFNNGGTWNPNNTWTMTWEIPPGSGGSGLWPLASPAQELVHLPIAPTAQNAELLRLYVKLISPFKASLDGNPESNNPYIKYYVPFTVQSPFLVHVAIYTAACFLNETGHLDNAAAMAYKVYAINLINENLYNSKSSTTTSDEAIAGIIQLIVNEWYWGDANDLRAHLRGLRDLIRLRGGFHTLGLHGMLSKLAITSDVALALSFEIPPFLFQSGGSGSDFDFQENTQVPLRLSINTPFIPPRVRFSTCYEALKLHPATASILDDMRFLISAVLALPNRASSKELQKVHSTCEWIYERISSLPSDPPAARRRSPSAAASPALSPSSAASPTGSLGSGFRETSSEASFSIFDQHVFPLQQSPQQQQTTPGVQRQQNQQGRRQSTKVPGLAEEQSQPSTAPTTGEPPDFIYQAVRLSALMYCRAIMKRRPFSSVVSTADFLQLWTMTWRVPLVAWKSLLGVFNWILLPLVPSSKNTPHDRFVKSMVNISLLQIGMDNWDVCREAMNGALDLQRWLRAESRSRESTAESALDDQQHGSRETRASEESDSEKYQGKGKGKEADASNQERGGSWDVNNSPYSAGSCEPG